MTTRLPRSRALTNGPRAWLVVVGVLVLGIWLPLAPGVHRLLDRSTIDAAHVHASAAGETSSGGIDHRSDRRGPASPGDHDESECSVCVQLGLAKRAGVAPAASLALRLDRCAEPVVERAPAPVRPRKLGSESNPRGPPWRLARA
ncbi:MAG TPA: DUF2946 family protein [Phycisphaerales bacterium]|nr:DUF2946 family protein [Phycisphaerales bacterium]